MKMLQKLNNENILENFQFPKYLNHHRHENNSHSMSWLHNKTSFRKQIVSSLNYPPFKSHSIENIFLRTIRVGNSRRKSLGTRKEKHFLRYKCLDEKLLRKYCIRVEIAFNSISMVIMCCFRHGRNLKK